MKTCSKCLKEWSETDFKPRGEVCAECHRQYKKNWYREGASERAKRDPAFAKNQRRSLLITSDGRLPCKKCKVAKPLSEYPKRGCACNECKLAYKRSRSQVLTDIIDRIKASPCMDCGRTFPPECMDFDHRVPANKKFAIAGAAFQFPQRVHQVLEEIKKCDLVCACCHRIRTRRRGDYKYRNVA